MQTAELAKVLRTPQQLTRAALGFAGELLIPGEVDEVAVDLLEESLVALAEEESLLRARVLGRLAMELYQSPSLTRSVSLSAQAVTLARRLGDIPTLAYVLSTRRYAMWSPDTLEERLAVTAEMVRLGEETGSKEMALLGHHWRVVDLLEKGDLTGMEAAMAAHTRLAEELRQRFHLWYSAVHRAMRTLLKGQLPEAERLIEQALTIGQQARLPVAMSLGGLQLLLLRREQGRMGEMEAPLRQFADRAPAFAITRYILAYFYSELERETEARQVFSTLPVRRLADAPQNLNWLVSLAHSAEVCAFLHDVDAAAMLYELLLPYADRNLGVGRATICYGSIMHFLGILATVLEHWEEAERHFTAALRRHEYMDARCLTAYTQHRHALMLQARGRHGDQEQAQALLTQTLATARELGMKGLEKKIQGLGAGGWVLGQERKIAGGPR